MLYNLAIIFRGERVDQSYLNKIRKGHGVCLSSKIAGISFCSISEGMRVCGKEWGGRNSLPLERAESKRKGAVRKQTRMQTNTATMENSMEIP